MTGLHDYHVFTVTGMRSMAVNGENAADPAMIERECTEVFGQEDDGKTLVLIRAEGPGRHDESLPEPKGKTEIIQSGNKFRIGYRQAMYLEFSDIADNSRFF